MHVKVLASTAVDENAMYDAYDYVVFSDRETTDADALSEAAGRICYKSFSRSNPATASNAGYLDNILAHEHHSVLEHASVTFLVRGISRSLLTELTRHRHLSFSVVSQRYVDYSETEPVIPPALENYAPLVQASYKWSMEQYETFVHTLLEEGLSRKQAREAARAVLPNAAPVDMIVTGNLRAWRDVLYKRHSVHADAEIQQFAGKVLRRLRGIAPNSFADFPEEPLS